MTVNQQYASTTFALASMAMHAYTYNNQERTGYKVTAYSIEGERITGTFTDVEAAILFGRSLDIGYVAQQLDASGWCSTIAVLEFKSNRHDLDACIDSLCAAAMEVSRNCIDKNLQRYQDITALVSEFLTVHGPLDFVYTTKK